MGTTEKKIKENITSKFESGLTLIRRYDTTIPVLEIRYKDTIGYLSPFRRYRFQVSSTDDGYIDMGCSMTIDLAKLNSDELITHARSALYDWARCNYHGDIREVIFSDDLLGIFNTDPLISWIDNDVKTFLHDSKNNWKYVDPDNYFDKAWDELEMMMNHNFDN